MDLEIISSNKCFGGDVRFVRHESSTTRGPMDFSIFLPPAAASGPCPVLYWLSGLTCSPENFTVKAGAQQFAAQHGLILVAPDTSPRGGGVPGEDDDYDLGTAAGFYVDATTDGWRDRYRMYSYVSEELPALIEAQFPAATDRRAIAGHSMGGHGALVVALSNPGRYRSVSAFAPIVAPTRCPWGEKAFSAYLGPDRTTWAPYDACELIRGGAEKLPLLVDQGEDDGFLVEQLKPELLEAACATARYPMTLRRHAGYDHSYYFIASFIEDHVAHHASALA